MSTKRTIIFRCVPFRKELVTLALESGVDALIVPAAEAAATAGLARCTVLTDEEVTTVTLREKSDELHATQLLAQGKQVVIARGWEIIPIENLIAQSDKVAVEVGSYDEAKLAAGVLQRGVDAIVVLPEAAHDLKKIIAELRLAHATQPLETAEIVSVENVGMGHRVCVDTMSVLRRGSGMLCGNSGAFFFLVHAETEHNEYVAARPFRINAGAVHAYAKLHDDRTTYLGELKSGDEVMIVDYAGKSTVATIGRVKVEARPMLKIVAKIGDVHGAIFLQNAETIRLTRPDGTPVSVVELATGDTVLGQTDTAGRHFGMRIAEDITEE